MAPGFLHLKSTRSVEEASSIPQAAGQLGADASVIPISNRRKSIGFYLNIFGSWYELNHSTIVKQLSQNGISAAPQTIPYKFSWLCSTQRHRTSLEMLVATTLSRAPQIG